MIDGALPFHLLGRHVRGCSEDGAFARQAGRFLVGGDGCIELGETEIEELGDLFALVLRLHQKNIFRL